MAKKITENSKTKKVTTKATKSKSKVVSKKKGLGKVVTKAKIKAKAKAKVDVVNSVGDTETIADIEETTKMVQQNESEKTQDNITVIKTSASVSDEGNLVENATEEVGIKQIIKKKTLSPIFNIIKS